MSEQKEYKGTLYVVSTPIGNNEDITLRALDVLKKCDKIICENYKEAANLLRHHNINNELEDLNVKNEEEKYPELLEEIKEGKKYALISDHGTPVVQDPGYRLLKGALHYGIDVKVIPGVTSIMTALVRSGFNLDKFYFAGFLSRNTEERMRQLKNLSESLDTVCLLETPYRLLPLLQDAARIMPERPAYIGMNLTMDFETHHYGSFSELWERFRNKRVKAEFVLCFQGDHYKKIFKKKKKVVKKKKR